MSSSKNPSVKGDKKVSSVPPAPQETGAPASFAPKPNVQAPTAADAVVVGADAATLKPGITETKVNAKPVGSADSSAAKDARPTTPRPEPIGPRRVRLAVTRIDPWSAMKMSFLLSIAAGIMMVVASIVFWNVLDGLHVFTEIDTMVKEILGEDTEVNILQYVELSRVVSLSTIIAIVDIVLLTALGTIGAFLYNVVAALVGGVHLTLTDD